LSLKSHQYGHFPHCALTTGTPLHPIGVCPFIFHSFRSSSPVSSTSFPLFSAVGVGKHTAEARYGPCPTFLLLHFSSVCCSDILVTD
jgi:hypothetical protein